MSGAPDPLYLRARTALLNAADALAEQLDAVVLVGAQAIYIHTGDADFAVAEYTTDADFCIAPDDSSATPLLDESFASARLLSERTPWALDEPRIAASGFRVGRTPDVRLRYHRLSGQDQVGRAAQQSGAPWAMTRRFR